MSDEEKNTACGKDQRICSVIGHEIADLGCPASEADLGTWFEANRGPAQASDRQLEECHEAIKLRMRVLGTQAAAAWGDQLLAALTANPKRTLKV